VPKNRPKKRESGYGGTNLAPTRDFLLEKRGVGGRSVSGGDTGFISGLKCRRAGGILGWELFTEGEREV